MGTKTEEIAREGDGDVEATPESAAHEDAFEETHAERALREAAEDVADCERALHAASKAAEEATAHVATREAELATAIEARSALELAFDAGRVEWSEVQASIEAEQQAHARLAGARRRVNLAGEELADASAQLEAQRMARFVIAANWEALLERAEPVAKSFAFGMAIARNAAAELEAMLDEQRAAVMQLKTPAGQVAALDIMGRAPQKVSERHGLAIVRWVLQGAAFPKKVPRFAMYATEDFSDMAKLPHDVRPDTPGLATAMRKTVGSEDYRRLLCGEVHELIEEVGRPGSRPSSASSASSEPLSVRVTRAVDDAIARRRIQEQDRAHLVEWLDDEEALARFIDEHAEVRDRRASSSAASSSTEAM